MSDMDKFERLEAQRLLERDEREVRLVERYRRMLDATMNTTAAAVLCLADAVEVASMTEQGDTLCGLLDRIAGLMEDADGYGIAENLRLMLMNR